MTEPLSDAELAEVRRRDNIQRRRATANDLGVCWDDRRTLLAEVDRLKARVADLEEALEDAGRRFFAPADAAINRIAERLDVVTKEFVDAKVVALRAHVARLLATLATIQQWDCLNPPRRDLCDDFGWLKRTVDAALAETAEKETT